MRMVGNDLNRHSVFHTHKPATYSLSDCYANPNSRDKYAVIVPDCGTCPSLAARFHAFKYLVTVLRETCASSANRAGDTFSSVTSDT